MTTTQNTLETLTIGTTVTVTSRKGIVGTVIGQIKDAAVFGDLVLIDFGKGRKGYNTPAQCTIA